MASSLQMSPPPSPAIVPTTSAPPRKPQVDGGVAAAFSFLFFFTACFRKVSRKRTVPADSKPPHSFSYSVLRHATANFSASRLLGQGGFGSVYRGTLNKSNQEVAVKLMDSGSLQGEREFQNEVFFAGKIDSNRVVSVLGFSSDPKHGRMLLLYELMSNGSLQDCLLHRKCAELMEWKKRFSIALDIAKGLEYLHHHCDPPVIHGDIKPSNILLDTFFNAKIGDFGLARLKSQQHVEISINEGFEEKRKGPESNRVSVMEETESVMTTGVEDFNFSIDQSPESFVRVRVAEAETVTRAEASPETVAPVAFPSEDLEKGSVSDGNFDGNSVESGKEMMGDGGVKQTERRQKNISGKEKQDQRCREDSGGAESGDVKDYVMKWIGNEIKQERPKSEWIGDSSNLGPVEKTRKKKNRKRLDWWASMDDDKNVKRDKRRPAREWWKEEYCEELERKKKKKKKKKKQGVASTSDDTNIDNWWPREEDMYVDRRKKTRRRSSWGSVDWWLDGLSGELWRARRGSHDSTGGDTPRSGVSSTPSMRGTVFYVAPEYGSGGDLSEKCDVYSFGVLFLVLIAGRRPLQVTGAHSSEFHRANIISWARHLARAGKLLDLVDESIQSLDREQALLCTTIALLCLQKSPARRPTMKEVVGMLSGEREAPQLPVEFSPSPPTRFPFKPHRK